MQVEMLGPLEVRDDAGAPRAVSGTRLCAARAARAAGRAGRARQLARAEVARARRDAARLGWAEVAVVARVLLAPADSGAGFQRGPGAPWRRSGKHPPVDGGGSLRTPSRG